MDNFAKSKVFRNQLFSLFSVLTFASLVSLSLFYATTRQMRKEITDNSFRSVLQMKENIDQSLGNVQNFAQSLSLYPEIIAGCNLECKSYGAIAISNGSIREFLHKQKPIDTSIEEICTIYFNQDTIITSNYSYLGDLSDAISNKLFGMDYDGLLSFLESTAYQGTFLTRCAGTDGEKVIFTAYPVFNSFNYKPGGVVLISLNMDSLLSSSASWNMIDNNYMIYSDPTDVLFSTDPSYEGIIRAQIAGEKPKKTRPGASDVIISSVLSDVAALEYYLLINDSSLFKNLNRLITRILFADILAFLVGTVISLFWARKNYSPIRDIVTTLNENSPKADAMERIDEFQHIRTTIDTLLTRQADNEKTLMSNAELIETYLLLNLLSGNIENSGRFQSVIQKYHLGITGNTFLICVLSLPTLHNKTFDASSGQFEQMTQMKSMVSARIGSRFSPGNPVLVIDNNHDLVLLYNLESADNRPLICMNDIYAFFERFIGEYREIFGTKIYFVITREYDGIKGISEAYEEAEELLDYAYMSGACDVPVTQKYRHDREEADEFGSNHIHYLKAERNILNCIILTQYKEAADHLVEIHEKYGSDSAQDRYTRAHVIKTIQAYLVDISSIFPHEFAVSLDLKKAMAPSLSVEERYAITISHLNAMDEFQKKNLSIENRVAKNILDFIEQNYHDPNLSRDMIADGLGFSISSISHITKNQTGRTLTELINEKRVSKACELLKTTSLSLQKIAEQVGYTNTWTFSRAVKNATGVSPGKFRDTM